MKKLILLIIAAMVIGCFCSCAAPDTAQVAATTLPVYEFSSRICQGTGLSVGRLVTENVSCLHDYSVKVNQMRMIEGADTVVISGAGLEDFLADVLADRPVIDASAGVQLLCPEHTHDHHGHDDGHHHHDNDPHYWLSPDCAIQMANNICSGLSTQYPQYADTFSANTETLIAELETLKHYGEQTLFQLSCRELITFHDGFAYLAEAFHLHILEAIEEESGQEASAAELKELIRTVTSHQLPAVFTETNGSASAADVIAAETGCKLYSLDMAMSGDSYFTAMYHNIDTLKEALG